MGNTRIDKLVQSLTILVVDDNQYMRKVVRNILVNLGVKSVHEAPDGIAASRGDWGHAHESGKQQPHR